MLQQVTEALSTGEPVPLPDEVIAEMARRRAQEGGKRPYTEIHRTITIYRQKDHKEKSDKEKAKRKMQKDSRRKNRGK